MKKEMAEERVILDCIHLLVIFIVPTMLGGKNTQNNRVVFI